VSQSPRINCMHALRLLPQSDWVLCFPNRESEVERADAGVARTSDVDTDDEANEADEYNLWKQRELKRIKRDRDLREAYASHLPQRSVSHARGAVDALV
jgi:hypothetical protein